MDLIINPNVCSTAMQPVNFNGINEKLDLIEIIEKDKNDFCQIQQLYIIKEVNNQQELNNMSICK